MEHINDLLKEISEKIKIYNESSTEKYNIFKVLGVYDKEVMMCRVLFDILNPRGHHNNGSIYLKSFLQDILKMEDIEDTLLRETRVYKEFLIEEDRRIDIVIKNDKFFIPIEVKIHAGEQENQCYDYYIHALKHDSNAKVVYLTKFGTAPSEYSTHMINKSVRSFVPANRIVFISFAEHIRIWLEKLIKGEIGIIKDILSQYVEAIEEFTERPNKELLMKISDTLSLTENNLRTGLQIAISINQAKANIIYKVMEEIEKQMEPLLDKYGLQKEERFKWYTYENNATETFYTSNTTYPGINYVVKGIDNDFSIWLRIEVEHCLFAGFCLFNNKLRCEFKIDEQPVDVKNKVKEKVKSYLSGNIEDTGSWWLLWRYMPTGAENRKIDFDLVPNFKAMNDSAICLADAEKRVEFAKKTVGMIETSLLALIKNDTVVRG
ncbi:MAG: PD-(D/E)XK nuclease family protein [Lachnospiraceae bacterium]|nr:PD-(D/E)XK nuclease family protein [Lachnospiraceae bacterium]